MIEFIKQYWLEVAFGGALTVLVGCIKYMFRQYKVLKAEYQSLKMGMQAILREQLVKAYNHYHEEKKFCPIYARESIEQMYKQYHALGGNGTITHLYNELIELPTQGG